MDECSRSVSSDYDLDDTSALTVINGQEDTDEGYSSSRSQPPAFSTFNEESSKDEDYHRWSRNIEYILTSCAFVNSLYAILKFPELIIRHNGGKFTVFHYPSQWG